MNSLERVNLILQHKEADRVPVYPIVNSVSRKTLGITYEEWTRDVNLCAESIIKITDELDLDVICTLVDLSVEAADWGQELIYFDDKAACPDHNNKVINSPEDYSKIKRINPRETPRMSEHIELCKKLVEARGKEKPIVAFVFGPLGIAGMLRGQDKMFMDLIMTPDEIHSCLREITETLKEFCTAVIETGVHAIMFDTLFASKTIMSKTMWDEFEGVYMEEIAKHVRDQGCMVMIHNCGGGVYFDIQIERMQPDAISFLHIPDDCSSFEEVKEKYGDKTTLIGHIDPGWLMTATIEDVEEESKKQIDIFKKDGGFILSTGCEYPAPLDFDKAKTMVRVAKEYGKY
ncbi:uroporphyrinogen decarboxylase family protein [Wukongibacter baidiensis]|uniref:uroporphyrinogen decarboxylase family protein n=1 Tax=Wukongibacter baidiensis TaxID=1723361 RepID=UPI003D7F1AB2